MEILATGFAIIVLVLLFNKFKTSSKDTPTQETKPPIVVKKRVREEDREDDR